MVTHSLLGRTSALRVPVKSGLTAAFRAWNNDGQIMPQPAFARQFRSACFIIQPRRPAQNDFVGALCGSALFCRSTPFSSDKDGTLVDFDQTWGPAAYEVMKTLAAGHEGAFRRLAEVSRFNPRDKQFAPTRLPHGRCSTVYASALGAGAGTSRSRRACARRSASLFRIAALSSLTPIGDPAALTRRLGAAATGSASSPTIPKTRSGCRRACSKFSRISTSSPGDDFGFGAKPDPGMIVAFAGAFGIAPARIAVVGDTMADMLAARAAGAVAIGVLTGPAHREDIGNTPITSSIRWRICRSCSPNSTEGDAGSQPAADRRRRRPPRPSGGARGRAS